MNVNLPVECNTFVRSLVSQGRFESEEAAVVEGVRLLMSHEKLRAEVQKGVDQLDRGEWHDEVSVFSEIESEIRNIESARQGK